MMQGSCWHRALLVMTLCARRTAQQKYPSRNIEVIIPFAAGGGVDLIGRAMRPSLAEQLGQTVVVLNRDGAGRHARLRRARGAPRRTATRSLSARLRRSPMRRIWSRACATPPSSFDYICQVFENVFTIAVGPQLANIKTAKELLAAAQGQAGL